MKHLYHPSAQDPTHAPSDWWHESLGVPSTIYPALGTDIEAEVAIIGGGFTGLSAAYHLAKAHGIRAVVLERAHPGWGASGRNAGYCCMGGSALGWQQIIEQYGLEDAHAFYRVQQDSVALVENLLVSEGIDVDRTGRGGVGLAHRASALQELREDAELMADTFGANYALLDRSDLISRGMGGPHFHGGLAEDVGFGLNPYKYVIGLAQAAAKGGTAIFSGSPVTGWQRDGRRHRLTTPKGIVHADKVLIATNGYTPEDLHGDFGGRLLPVLSTILVTQPLTNAECAAAGWTDTTPGYDLLNLHNYFRLLPDGRFLFGGRAGNSARPSALARQSRWIESVFRRYYPAWHDVEITHRWSGFVCLAGDRLPHIGAWDSEPGVYYALAYSGTGIALGSWAGQAIASLMGDDGHRNQELRPTFMRRPPPRFPLPALRMLYQSYFYHKLAIDDLLRR